MIFSIFLIIVFIITAIYAIKNFLDYKDCSITGVFLKDLQDMITTVFNKQGGISNFQGNLPSGIKYVCFANFSENVKGSNSDIGNDLKFYGGSSDNLFFYPRAKACGGLKTKKINNLNLPSIIKTDNPYCIPVINGKVTIRVSKGLSQGLVMLS